MPELDLPSLYLSDEDIAELPALASWRLDLTEGRPVDLSGAIYRVLGGRDLAYTLAVMSAPHKPAAHHRLIHAIDVQGLRDALADGEQRGRRSKLDGELHSAIVNTSTPEKVARSLVGTHDLRARAAAFILRWLVEQHADDNLRGDGVASAAKAFEAVIKAERERRRNRDEPAWRQVTAGNLVDNVWPRYRSVSHLWAAFYAMPADADLVDTAQFVTFLARAEVFLRKAALITPKHGRKPVIYLDSAWRMPNVLVELKANQLHAQTMQALRAGNVNAAIAASRDLLALSGE